MTLNITDRKMAVAAALVFLCSFLLLAFNIGRPGYGGDELWFATPFMNGGTLARISLFQFVYAGPVKSILTYPLFLLFGFNIFTVRIFSLITFLLIIALWGRFLIRNGQYIALAFSLLAASFNFDLLFFARTDIIQPTFHNLFILLSFLVFLQIMNGKKGVGISLLFVALACVVVNNHIRHIWVLNAYVAVLLIDHWLESGSFSKAVASLPALLKKYRAVLAGWLIAAVYFAYTLVHFSGNPGLEAGWDLGRNVTWAERIPLAFANLCRYAAGGMVLHKGYSSPAWSPWIVAAGAIFLVLAAAAAWTVRSSSGEQPGRGRLFRTTALVLVFVFLQYVLTKSAKHPWHGNSLMLFLTLFSALLVQRLYDARKVLPALVLVLYILPVMALFNVTASRRISDPDLQRKGFGLAVWSLPALDEVRAYILEHPGKYVVADWGIGRPIVLEQRFRPVAGIVAVHDESPFSRELVDRYSGYTFIRSTPVSFSIPNYTDARLVKAGDAYVFRVDRSFSDPFGREVYQAGTFIPR